MAISRVVIERSRFHDIIEDRAIHLHTHLLQTFQAVLDLLDAGFTKAGDQKRGSRCSGYQQGIRYGKHGWGVDNHDVIQFVYLRHYGLEAFTHEQLNGM